MASDCIRVGQDWRRYLEKLVGHFRGGLLPESVIRDELKSSIVDAHSRYEVSLWVHWHSELGTEKLRSLIVECGGWAPCINRRIKLIRKAEETGNIRHLRPLLPMITPRPHPPRAIDFTSDDIEVFQESFGTLVFHPTRNVWPIL
jgi:hypothetical protein